MSSGAPPYKPPAKPDPAATPAGSGEGAQSALAAMIKKRQAQAQRDETLPPQSAPATTQAQQPLPKKPQGPAE